MPKSTINHTVEDYLRAIYRVAGREGKAATSALARELGISPAAVTEMVRRLGETGLLEYERYQGVRLTTRGQQYAVGLTRRHRLWEVFLIERLGYEWDQVHDIADELEHVGPDELIDRLATYLGNPTRDPHGDAIPGRDGTIEQRALVPLGDLAPEESGVIARVEDEFPELLRFAATLGLEIGTQVRVLERIAFDGSLRVQTPGGQAIVSKKLAASVWLERDTPTRRTRRGGGA